MNDFNLIDNANRKNKHLLYIIQHNIRRIMIKSRNYYIFSCKLPGGYTMSIMKCHNEVVCSYNSIEQCCTLKVRLYYVMIIFYF